MKRRNFLSLLVTSAAAWPLAAGAQQSGKTYRLGWLQPSCVPDAWSNAFKQGLEELNYIEGKNLTIEYRWGDGNFEHISEWASELIRLNVDAIVSSNTVSLRALQKATQTIPIVMLGPSAPVELGLVGSLARPGGNVTGLSMMAPEVSGKRLQLLTEIVPKLGRVTILSNPNNPAVVRAGPGILHRTISGVSA